ncbi:MAG: PASTA domain-containing protein [Flavobacteriales bacterium]|nr:PASTA domain-containing protein [Flavobacteriales bacterium]
MKQIAAAVVVVLLVIGGLYVYLGIFTDHGNHVQVPDVKGMSVQGAAEALGQQGLNYVVIDSVYSENAIGGSILEQNPLADSKVKSNRDIYLTIFRKTAPSEEVKVKEGMAEGVAEIILNNKGIHYEKQYESNQVLAGMVIRVMKGKKELSPKDQIRKGDQVLLVIGKGSEEKVFVPSVRGLTLDSAEKVLLNARLTLGYPFFEGDLLTLEDSLNCRVSGQTPSPSSETKVLVGTPVDLFLKIPAVKPAEQDSI